MRAGSSCAGISHALSSGKYLRSASSFILAGISVELGMSVQNKSGIWCKPTVKMDLKIDGGTNPQQREAIIKQAFDEVCDNIEKTISEME